MHSLKTKLIVTISVLIFVLFMITAFLFIGQKQRELTQDIFTNARSFAELTAPTIANDYNLYLAQKSFVYFNREIQNAFEKFQDLASIQVINYNGEILYDSNQEKDHQYEGQSRKLQDQNLLGQIQAKNPSVFTLDTKRTVYLKKDNQGQIKYIDANEKPLQQVAPDEKINYLVQPASNELSIVYGISYQNLQARVNQTILRGILLALFGIGLGIILAFLYAASITKPISKLTAGVSEIAIGNFKTRVEVKTKDEIKTLADAFNKMAADLEVSTKALLYKERVAKELELAAKIQKQILPKVMPIVGGLDIAAGLIPAEEIGGDCYDFLKTDDNNLLMYLGDVTGHGVPSGLMVSIANALIYTFAGKKDMKSLLIDVNKVMKDKTASNMFLTLVMLNWNSAQNHLTYVNAGHEQMIHFHAKEQKVTLEPTGGMALGMLSDISKLLQEREITLEKDDVLVLYSDGIPECWKDPKEIYGMVRFKRAISEYSDLPTSAAIRNALLADVKEFSGDYKQMDDITLIVLKRKG